MNRINNIIVGTLFGNLIFHLIKYIFPSPVYIIVAVFVICILLFYSDVMKDYYKTTRKYNNPENDNPPNKP
jgi:VanZ family protein